MSSLDPQAQSLNDTISQEAPVLYNCLSERGRAIYFPAEGILAQTAEAKGKKINATIGIALEEDGTPMALNTAAGLIKLSKKEVFPYAEAFGNKALREIWREQMLKKNPRLRKEIITFPVVTAGLTHGLCLAGYLFSNPGDTLIMPDLFWSNYSLIFEKTFGAEIKPFKMFKNDGFNSDGLRTALTFGGASKKIVLLNFPNNPTGYTPTQAEAGDILQAILKGAEAGNEIVVIIDDAYFGLTYEAKAAKESLFSALSEAHSRITAIKIDGPTKEDYSWGLRVGFVTLGHPQLSPKVSAALENKLAGAVRATVSSTSQLSQNLLLKTMQASDYEQQKKEKNLILKERYEAVRTILAEHPEYQKVFKPLPFNSGYFMCVELQGNLAAEPIRQKLLTEYDTGLIALEKLIRIAFSAVPLKDLPLLFENLYRVARKGV